MKLKITKSDFLENGGKLFLSYLDILNKWESEGVGKTLNLLAEKIAKKYLIDHGFNDSNWSQQRHTLQSAGRQIRKLFVSKQSAKKNFEIDIEFDTDTGDIQIVEKPEEPPADQQADSVPIEEEISEDKIEDSDRVGDASNDTISYLSLPASPEMPSGLHEHVMDKIDEVIQKLEASTAENSTTTPSLAIKSEAVSVPTNEPESVESDQPPTKKIKSSENDEFNDITELPKTQPLDLRT